MTISVKPERRPAGNWEGTDVNTPEDDAWAKWVNETEPVSAQPEVERVATPFFKEDRGGEGSGHFGHEGGEGGEGNPGGSTGTGATGTTDKYYKKFNEMGDTNGYKVELSIIDGTRNPATVYKESNKGHFAVVKKEYSGEYRVEVGCQDSENPDCQYNEESFNKSFRSPAAAFAYADKKLAEADAFATQKNMPNVLGDPYRDEDIKTKIATEKQDLFIKKHPTTYYHGTSDKTLASIKKNGIVANKEGGAIAWMIKTDPVNGRRLLKAEAKIEGRNVSVFLTQDKEVAMTYAARTVELSRRSKPILITIKLPNDIASLIKVDELSETDLKSFRLEQTIHPDWIVSYKELVPIIQIAYDDPPYKIGVSREGFIEAYIVLVEEPVFFNESK